MSGYNSVMAGSVTLNGNGLITAGTVDIEAPGTTLSGADLTIASGSYTVGSDNRGTLSFKDANGNSFTFAIAIGGDTSGVDIRGYMIETDSNPLEMTGQFNLQTASAFSTSAFSGSYAFGFEGWDSTPAAQTVVGSFTVASGAISAGLLDADDDGVLMSNTAFTGSVGTVSSDGRGSFTATLGNSKSETFTTYVISTGNWIAIGTTSGGPVSGEVLQQAGPFSNSSLSGNAVLAHQSENGVPAPHAAVGLASFASGNSFTGTMDVNDGGSATGGVTLNASFTGTWVLTSAANGRITLTPAGADTLVGYLVGPNEAFTAETTSGKAPDFGVIQPQQLNGGVTNASLNGSIPAGTLPLLSPGTPGSPPPALNIYSGVFTFNGAGGASATLDVNSSGVSTSGITGTDTYSVAANGRGTLGSGSYVLWIVNTDPLEIYALQTSQSQPSSANPVVLFMAPGAGSSGGSSGLTFLSWPGNANGSTVLDAAGNKYGFSSSSGCLYLASGGSGPAGFCLTADSGSQTGYDSYGATGCQSPQSNSQCNSATFNVELTNAPSGSGCIAVLGNASSSTLPKDVIALSVQPATGSGFTITSTDSPSAYTAYFSGEANGGRIPICGGSNPYAGTYAGVWSLNDTGGSCYLGAFTDTLTIDSGGILYDKSSGLLADIDTSGTGSGDLSFDNSLGAYGITITGTTKNANGKWVISGLGTGFTGSSSCGTFTLTEN